jgi:transposase-like protein
MPSLWRERLPYRPWGFEKKGLGGGKNGYLPFFIKRFRCKKTGNTVSVHPIFSHSHQRYLLPFVIDCLKQLIDQGRSICSVAREKQMCRQTLKRWKHSFIKSHTETKRIAFFPHGQPPGSSLGTAMLSYFRSIACGDVYKGAALGMVCLHDGFSCPLY